MNAALYYDPVYFDAEWGLHHVVSRIVGAIFSGIVQTANHFVQMIEFVIKPKAVVIENIWSNNAAGGYSCTVAINVSAAPNKYIVVCVVQEQAGYGFAATLAGASMTTLVVNTTNRAAAVFGLIPSATGAQNVVVTTAAAGDLRVVVYECSGVNQSTPTLDAKSANTAGATSITTPSMASSVYGKILDGGSFASGTISATSGQTPTTVNSKVSSGSLTPAGATQTTSYGTTSSSAGSIAAASLNPA